MGPGCVAGRCERRLPNPTENDISSTRPEKKTTIQYFQGGLLMKYCLLPRHYFYISDKIGEAFTG